MSLVARGIILICRGVVLKAVPVAMLQVLWQHMTTRLYRELTVLTFSNGHHFEILRPISGS